MILIMRQLTVMYNHHTVMLEKNGGEQKPQYHF